MSWEIVLILVRRLGTAAFGPWLLVVVVYAGSGEVNLRHRRSRSWTWKD